MHWKERLSSLERVAKDVVFGARTVGRVAIQTKMPSHVRWAGLEATARELLRTRKAAPPLLFHFMAHNDPHTVGLVGLSASPSGRLVEERAYSFQEMNERIERIAAGLAERGVRPDDRIALMIKNRPEFVLLQIAAGKLGCGAVSCSFRSTPSELEYVATHSGARALFFDVDVAETVREAAPKLAQIGGERCFSVGGEVASFPTLEALVASAKGPPPKPGDEPAVVMYTSGTTGKPKGAVRQFAKGATSAAFAFIGETPMQMGEVHLAVCPLYHATAFGFITMSYLVGSTVIVLRDFRPESFLEAIERYRVTTTAVVPTMLHRIVELGEEKIRRYDTSSLKAIFTGGAAISIPLANEVLRLFGDKLFNFYGATETGVVTLAKPADLRAAPGTIGRTIPGAEVRLYDEAGRVCGPGEVGELYARSGQLFSGYHADDAGTRDAMRDGFFSVGDLARRDERGYFFLEGRKRDMIISGGVNVYPAEVEHVLHDHPAVAEVAIVGVPDEAWGERVRAFVVLKAGARAESKELEAFARARLSGAKVPREFVFVPSLPRNPTGKVLKRELRAMAL
ncbi:class I adenylate-forming enzyme family protein [Polyangium mundeleinium]|uniref:AMP-binding protein n=1 Tax=Polyangium mundeleinium TaxID=2995306 RepID=A0ABT5F6I6_9BACT|nr:AMP-binding protein [Polyangium mundeleinium]MDC0749229.1 AMP-binding protein [Polyangium mundeleinium]